MPTMIRAFRAPSDRPMERKVYLLPVDHVLDGDSMPIEEIRAMQRAGTGEWRVNLDAPTPASEDIFVRIPASERAN